MLINAGSGVDGQTVREGMFGNVENRSNSTFPTCKNMGDLQKRVRDSEKTVAVRRCSKFSVFGAMASL